MSLRSCDRSREQSSIVFDSLSLARVGDFGRLRFGSAAVGAVTSGDRYGHALSKFVGHRRVERLLRCGITWLSDGKQEEDEKDEKAWGSSPDCGEIAGINGGRVVRKACGGASAAACAGWVSLGPRTDPRFFANLFD